MKRKIYRIDISAYENGETYLTIFRTGKLNTFREYRNRRWLNRAVAICFGYSWIKCKPAILNQDERAELEQRLYEAQMLEGMEMEY